MVFKNMHFHVHTFAVAGVIIVIAHSYVRTSAVVWPNFCRTLSHILQGLSLG